MGMEKLAKASARAELSSARVTSWVPDPAIRQWYFGGSQALFERFVTARILVVQLPMSQSALSFKVSLGITWYLAKFQKATFVVGMAASQRP